MKPTVFVLILTSLIAQASARLVPAWPFSQMLDSSDLVIIGKPLSTKSTSEKAKLNGINPPFDANGLNTEFEIQAVIKGNKDIKSVTLHHYRPDSPSSPVFNGPTLVSFPKEDHSSYILFLTRESDGRYQAVTGQVDPSFAICRIDR